jgi:hypothetical protein
MKLLIYGIDGGDLAVMKKFPMPFLRRFLAKNESVELTSDLIHRGWAEILTGKGGEHTGAFYMAPALDGTHKCSTTFRMNMLDRRTDIKPMWRLFEEAHLPFLIMNVPTTTPVPKVTNGIVIGSAGGGLNKIEGIPDDLMSDPSVRETLDRHQYIVDIRIPTRDYTQTVGGATHAGVHRLVSAAAHRGGVSGQPWHHHHRVSGAQRNRELRGRPSDG